MLPSKSMSILLLATSFSTPLFGMQKLKRISIAAVVAFKKAAGVVNSNVVVPVVNGVQNSAATTKDMVCTLGRKTGEGLGCVRRRNPSHKSKKDD